MITTSTLVQIIVPLKLFSELHNLKYSLVNVEVKSASAPQQQWGILYELLFKLREVMHFSFSFL